MSTLSINQSPIFECKTIDMNVMDTLQRWVGRNTQRKQLAQLSDHMLNDIGITREQALNEARKPFWQ